MPRALASRASPSPPPPDGRGSSLAARAGSRSDASVSTERAAHHYDAVTEAWRRWVMGDDLHFGLFASPSDTLAEATARLTRTLASRAALEPELEVLDLGCGVGTSALRLAQEESCYVTGVSTSSGSPRMIAGTSKGCAPSSTRSSCNPMWIRNGLPRAEWVGFLPEVRDMARESRRV